MKPFFLTHTISFVLTVSTLLLLSSISQAQAQVLYDNYETPKTAFGQADISGQWTNVTITKLTRSIEYGDRLVYTEEEVASIEGKADLEAAEAIKPVDPNAPAEYRHDSSVELRPEFAAAGGAVGFYDHYWLDPGSRVMRIGGEPRTSLLTTKNGQIPRSKTDAPTRRSRSSMGAFDSYLSRPLGERCIIGFGRNGGPPMYPNGFYNNNYNIIQTPDHVMILVEMIHDARIVRLNSEHRTDKVRPWFGDSIGWWDNNTLVVETTHIPQAQAFNGSWENLKVTEYFTRVADSRLHYKFVVEDNSFWDAPWGGEYEFSILDGDIYEYACHEGNYALPGILQGARVEEANAK